MMPKNTWLTRSVRLTIMFSLILLFFIISPLVILYTAGYRYDFKTYTILKTGVISVDIKPRSATVSLNAVPIEKKIPLRLTNRAPGSYVLELTDRGYHPWKQIISVSSKQTTYITDVQLFQKNLPTRIKSSFDITTSTEFSPAPNNPYYLVYTNNADIIEVGLYSANMQQYTPTIRTNGHSISHIHWSPYTSLVSMSIQTEKSYKTYILNAETNSISKPIETLEEPILYWSSMDTAKAYIRTAYTPWQQVSTEYSPTTQNTTAPMQKISSATEPIANWYTQKKIPSGWVLKDSSKLTDIIIRSPIEHILFQSESLLLAQEGNTIKRFSLQNNEQAELEETIQDATIFTSKEYIYIISPWSITSVDRKNGEMTILFRTSNRLHHVSLLNPDRSELLLSTTNGLFIFDPRFTVLTPLLDKETTNAIINSDYTKVLFEGHVGNQETTLYELRI